MEFLVLLDLIIVKERCKCALLSLINENNISEKNQILEQYKLYVEMADKISERRSKVNTFFLTLNTTVLTVIGIKGFEVKKFSLIITIVGIILSYTWFYLLHSYKLMNSGKYKVINEIEEFLPLNLYSYEWKILDEGKNRAKYWTLTNLEKIIPVLFGIIYLIFGIII